MIFIEPKISSKKEKISSNALEIALKKLLK